MPKDTPAPIVEKLAAASAKATGSPAVQKRMKEIGVDPVAPDRRTPGYLAKFVEAEIAKWAGPVKASGLATE
jgi:tripartite-type tricarboxylate transporter receptor subunit TctC